MKNKVTRRSFIKSSAAFGGLMVLPSWCIGRQKGPNDRLNVAIVGAGGRGRASLDLINGSPDAQIVALCDVDEARAEGSFKDYATVQKFKDYRVMLDKMGADIDGVAVCTPDHMHFPVAAWAICSGKHVCVEKPLVRTVWESREILRLAKKHGVITQMLNQGHTFNGWRILKEWNEDGLLGEIEDIYASTDRPNNWWKQGPDSMRFPQEGEKIPGTLDYKLWLGVAPMRPYSGAFIPHDWRGVRSFGTGAVGDMACHILDAAVSALDLSAPVKIWGDSSPGDDYTFPHQTSVHMEFDSKYGVGGKVRVHLLDGGLKPEGVKRIPQESVADNTSYLVGTKNTAIVDTYGSRPMLDSRDLMKELRESGKFDAPSRIQSSPAPGNPQCEWVGACLAGEQPPSNFEYSAPFTEIALLLLIAAGCKEPVEYDAKKMRFKNCKEGNRLLHSLYEYNREFLPSEVKVPS